MASVDESARTQAGSHEAPGPLESLTGALAKVVVYLGELEREVGGNTQHHDEKVAEFYKGYNAVLHRHQGEASALRPVVEAALRAMVNAESHSVSPIPLEGGGEELSSSLADSAVHVGVHPEPRNPLEREARAMLTAVTYTAPPVDFGKPGDPNYCYECRIPIEFATRLEAALSTSRDAGASAFASAQGNSGPNTPSPPDIEELTQGLAVGEPGKWATIRNALLEADDFGIPADDQDHLESMAAKVATAICDAMLAAAPEASGGEGLGASGADIATQGTDSLGSSAPGHLERDTTRIPACDLTDAEMVEEQGRVERLWDSIWEPDENGDVFEGGGGSPGEWLQERMGEIATEQARRAALGKFCQACQAIPKHGYCRLAGCPTGYLDVEAKHGTSAAEPENLRTKDNDGRSLDVEVG